MPNTEAVFNVPVYHDSLAVIQDSQNSGPSQLLKHGWSRYPYRNYLSQTNRDAPCHQNMPRGRYLYFPCLEYVTPILLFSSLNSIPLCCPISLSPGAAQLYSHLQVKLPWKSPTSILWCYILSIPFMSISSCGYQVLLKTDGIKFLKCIKLGFITETTSQHENSLCP